MTDSHSRHDSPLRRIDRQGSRAFLMAAAFVLGGYAFLGKGFAYLGLPPVYVGEMLFALGAVAYALAPKRWSVFHTAVALFIALACVHVAAGYAEHGFAALRDAAAVGYAAFAVFIAAALRSRPDAWERLLGSFTTFAWLYPLVAGVLVWLSVSALETLPRMGEEGRPLLHLKPGDAGVLLCGCCVGLLALRTRVPMPQCVMVTATMLVLGLLNRASLLAFCIGIGLFVLMTVNLPAVRRGWIRLIAAAAAVLLVLAVVNVWVTHPRHGRTVEQRVSPVTLIAKLPLSFGRENANASSRLIDRYVHVQDPEVAHVARQLPGSTVSWRMNWWTSIIEQSLAADRWYAGHGLGFDLTEVEGAGDEFAPGLRNPHNVFMTHLGRMGVPGVVMWLGVLAAWVGIVGRAVVSAWRAKRPRWQALLAAILSTWVAALVNASFDVYLEGPMGAVWFWCLSGVGVAAVELYRRGEKAPGAGEDERAFACASIFRFR